MASKRGYWGEFLRAGHLGTLLTSLLYFDFCFAIWVLNGAMAPFISEELKLSSAETGMMVSMPVLAGALLRLPLGIVSEYIGRKNAALLNMAVVVLGLVLGYAIAGSSASVLLIGIPLGVAGASFGVALSLGSGSYPARFKGLAMGIAGAGNSGAVLAVLLAPPLARAFGWKTVYGLATLPMLVAMALLAWFAKEPRDSTRKPLSDYVRLLWDRDAWTFNVMYMVTFGGYIGLTSFLPTLFHEQYGIPKQDIGRYSALIILSASALRVVGGYCADHVGGLRLLFGLSLLIAATTLVAAALPPNPWVMVAVLIVCFSAMGAGNGAVFQLVPQRFGTSTAAASSLIGEIGALFGAVLPNVMGIGKQVTGSYSLGFMSLLALALCVTLSVVSASRRWGRNFLAEAGKALERSA